MLGVAELIECTNQGVLVVRLDCNVEVDCGGRTVPKLAKGNAEKIQNTGYQRRRIITCMPAVGLPGIPVGFQAI